MSNKLLIASEISPNAYDMVKFIKDLKDVGFKKTLLLQCLDSYEAKTTISSFVSEILEENLKKQKEILIKAGFEVQTRLVQGLVKNELIKIADEEKYSLIVAEAAGHSMLGGALYGGVAHDIIYNTSKPVLLVRPSEEYGLFDHIIFPTDFSENNEIAFEYLKNIMSDQVKKVSLIHVHDGSQRDEYSRNHLEKLKSELLKKSNVQVEIQILKGSPSAELIKFAKEEKASLILMGSQGRGFIKEIYVGSVSHNMARNSTASVILIPAKRN